MAAKHFVDWVERQGVSLRRQLNLAPLDILNPYSLAKKMQAQLFTPHDVVGLPDTILNQLLTEDPSSWSAGTMRLPNRQIVIILNPVHAETRKRATLMEELSHMHLNHTPTDLIVIKGKFATRCYKKTEETQAYWVGAAALLPRTILKYAQVHGINKETVAEKFQVSSSLVVFRTRVTGIPI